MKLKELGIICLPALCLIFPAYSENKLIVYPAPAEAELNDEFTVSVQQSRQAWQTLAAYLVNVIDL